MFGLIFEKISVDQQNNIVLGIRRGIEVMSFFGARETWPNPGRHKNAHFSEP